MAFNILKMTVCGVMATSAKIAGLGSLVFLCSLCSDYVDTNGVGLAVSYSYEKLMFMDGFWLLYCFFFIKC